MSLHLGNLSSRINKNDLERVFRRFGRCNIQVKDRYGFVVYDYPVSAEKALKTLRGTRICGEAITLSWSKKQRHRKPRSSGKSYEPPPHRNFSEGKKIDQSSGLTNQPQYQVQVDGEGRNSGSLHLVDEPIKYHQHDLKDSEVEVRRTSSNDHHMIGSDVRNHLEDDQWEEEAVDYLDEKYSENGIEFNRYEPLRVDDENELDELQDSSLLPDSISIRESVEGLKNAPYGKSQRIHNPCGEEGQKMDKCQPRLDILEGEETNKDQTEKKLDQSENNVKHCHSIPSADEANHAVENPMAPSLTKNEDSRKKDLAAQQTVEPKPDFSLRSTSLNSSRLSSEEIYMALKHYGLPYPNDNKKDLPVEIYFGSARSWPWEIIYYRRLRKGSIV